MNLENVLLWRNQSLKMGPYALNYQGPKVEPVNLDGFINQEYVWVDAEEHYALAKRPFKHGELQINTGWPL